MPSRTSPASESLTPSCVPDTDNMRHALAICVLFVTATAGAPGHPFSSWLPQDQPAAARFARSAAASPNEALPSALVRAWSEVANGSANNVIYLVQTKQELFVFGGEPPAESAPSSPSSPSSSADTSGSNSRLSKLIPKTRNNHAGPTPSHAPTTSAPPPITTIPPEYIQYNGSRSYYKIYKWQATWDVANATCGGEGARLITFDNAREVSLVQHILKGTRNYYATWTDYRNGQPIWDKDFSAKTQILLNEVYDSPYYPKESNSDRYCVVFSAPQRQLYRFLCDSTWHFICEISE